MTTLASPPVSTLIERLFADADKTQSAFRAERARLSPAERVARMGDAADYKSFYMTHAKNVGISTLHLAALAGEPRAVRSCVVALR